MSKKISIVIIGRNEERGIAKCVAAAREAAAQIGGAEIIYVDSASTDETVAVARSLDVRVVSLDSGRKLCPSLGRHAGTQAADGEFILFLDADTLIYKNFLPVALEYFRQHPELGGVNGRIDDTDECGILFDGVEDRFETVAEVEWLRGPACFYRRAALTAVGSFNPHLLVEEEAELGLRLVRSNWRLSLLPIPMARHTRCYHNQTFAGIFHSLRRDIATGRFGEIFVTAVCAFRQGFGLKFCWLRLKTTIFFSAVMLLPIAGYFLLPATLHPEILCAAFIIFVFFKVWRKKRSLYQTALFFPAKFLCLINVLGGILKIGFRDFERRS